MGTELTTVSYGVESSFGTPPTGSGDFNYLRLGGGGESLAAGIQTGRTGGFNANRLPGDAFLGGFRPAGAVNGVLGYDTHSGVLPYVFGQTAWSTARTTTAALTIVASTRTVTMVAAFADMAEDEWFEIEGSAATGANDGFYKILTRTSDDEVVVETYHTFAGGDEAATASVTIKHDGALTVGTTRTGITLEANHFNQGVSKIFSQFAGSVPASMALSMAVDGELQIVLNYICKTITESAATIAVGSIGAASVNRAFRAAGDVKAFYLNGLTSPSSYRLIDWGLTLDNGARQDPMQSDDAADTIYDVELGNVAASAVNATIYFAQRDIATQYLAFANLGAAWVLQNSQGTFVFDFPTLKASGGGIPSAGGENQPVTAPLTFMPNTNAAGEFLTLTRFAA